MLATVLVSGAEGMLGGTGGSMAASLFGAEKSSLTMFFLTMIGAGLTCVASLLAGGVFTTTGVGFAGAGLAFGSREISSGCCAGASLVC